MTEEIESTKTYAIVKNDIEQFLSLVNSHAFTTSFIDRQFNIRTRDAKRYRWQILEQFVANKRLEQIDTGKYRKVDSTEEEVSWRDADVDDVLKLNWPLNLNKYIKVWHKSINILAGAPGAGKTAFLYNFLLANMFYKDGVVLFTNDMTPEEIKERLINADIEIPDPAPFKVFDRADNFADVIRPNAINIIDYLDLNSEVYLIGDEIEKIYRKLDRGIALIAIQKKPYQEVGIGGVFSTKRAKLYLTLDGIKEDNLLFHKLTIYKARGRANPLVNPKGMEIKFKLQGGINFLKI